LKILAKNIGANLVLQILTFAFPLLTLPYLTQVIGGEAFGLVSYYGVVAGCFSIFVSYGFDHSATRQVPKLAGDNAKLEELFVQTQFAKWVLIFCSAVVYFIWLITRQLDSQAWSIAWASFFVTLGVGLMPNWFLQGKMRLGSIVWVTVWIRALALILVFYLIKTPQDAWLFPFLTGISIIGPSLLGTWGIMRRYNFKWQNAAWQSIPHILSSGRWMFGISLLLFLNQSISVLLIEQWYTFQEVGVYSLGWRLMNVVMAFFLGPILNSIFPISAERILTQPDKGIREIQSKTLLIIGLLLAVSIGYFLMVQSFFDWIFPVEFHTSVRLLGVLLCVPMLGLVTHMISIQILVNLGKEQMVFHRMVILSITGWAGLSMSTYWFGTFGAALGSVALEGILCIGFVHHLYRHKKRILAASHEGSK
jgi:O-antigen/teichoic acid export membrane protein